MKHLPKKNNWKRSKLRGELEAESVVTEAFLLSYTFRIYVFTGYIENNYKLELFPEKTLVAFCALRVLLLQIKYT